MRQTCQGVEEPTTWKMRQKPGEGTNHKGIPLGRWAGWRAEKHLTFGEQFQDVEREDSHGSIARDSELYHWSHWYIKQERTTMQQKHCKGHKHTVLQKIKLQITFKHLKRNSRLFLLLKCSLNYCKYFRYISDQNHQNTCQRTCMVKVGETRCQYTAAEYMWTSLEANFKFSIETKCTYVDTAIPF